ncbi:MAG: hypothetical protein KME52_27795 [Desmonostoc geniculatum HA4340-LM1]|jgi:DNA-binding HxlR family transcriptional regulator|nr:hypothetical protein [Desmonostoc geniculatum HA4340-LM1]
MNRDTCQKLRDAALSIEKLRSLHDSEQEWLLPLLGKSVLLALKILDAIAFDALTFEEIASECDCSKQAVSQILNALEQGGMSIQIQESSAFAPVGRLRKLAKR